MFTKYRPLFAPEAEAGSGATTTEETPVVTTETPSGETPAAAGEQEQQVITPPDETVPANAIAKRIDALTAEKWDYRRKAESAEARAAAAETMLAEMQRKATDGTTTTPTAGTEQLVPASEVNRRAEVIAEDKVFGAKCARVYNDAKAQFADFDTPLNALKSLSPSVDARGQPALTKEFLEAIFEAEADSDTGAKAADIMYALGKDTTTADRIMSMPATKQAVAIAKFASKVQPKAAPGTMTSGAPAPIRPRVGAGSTVTNISPSDKDESDKLSTKEWMEARKKELERKSA